jgi:hypothetical protein
MHTDFQMENTLRTRTSLKDLGIDEKIMVIGNKKE